MTLQEILIMAPKTMVTHQKHVVSLVQLTNSSPSRTTVGVHATIAMAPPQTSTSDLITPLAIKDMVTTKVVLIQTRCSLTTATKSL
jgi:hypothetical protein